MIIPNGAAQFLSDVEGTIDPDTGYAVKSDGAWGEPIPCQAVTTEHDALAVAQAGGAFTERHYQLLFDGQPAFKGGSLRLMLSDGSPTAVFSVKRVEYWAAVIQTCVWV